MSAAADKVIIAGGGIGGLATAIALAGHGIASEVCERRPEFPDEGAGIQIGPNGTRILQSLGVADFLTDKIAIPDALSVRDGATGRELTRLPLGAWLAARHGAPYWTAHRRDLHAALRQRASALPLIKLSTGVEIRSFASDDDTIIATTDRQETLHASALVAADGLWSQVRAQTSAGRVPQPIGKTAFRTVVDGADIPRELQRNDVHIWLAPRAHAVHYPVNAGRDIALVVIADELSREKEWDCPAAAASVKNRIAAFADVFQSLAARATSWRQWSLHDMPALDHLASGRIALVGDAAHPVLPFLAQGAVMALEDGVSLAAQLADRSQGVESALRAYEQTRKARVDRVARTSRRNGAIYHMRGPAALARNTVLQMTPPQRVMRGFDWLYGWTC